MARPLRVQYAGARYHVMCRGNRRERVLGEARDKRLFLHTFSEVAKRTGWLVHAHALLDTHWHLLLETPEANLVKGMRWFQSVYAQRRNRAHQTTGHVYQGRYKAKVIDDRDPAYFRVVSEYIHLNPVEAGLSGPMEADMAAYPWTSFGFYLASPSKRPVWLRTGDVLLANGVLADSPKGRRAYGAYLAQRAQWLLAEKAKRKGFKAWWRAQERGWIEGNEAFRDRMLAHLAEGYTPRFIHDGEQRRACGQAAAAKIVPKALQVVGLTDNALSEIPKGDERKRLLAGWLKRHFTVSNKWISGRLHMGHISRVSASARFYDRPPREFRRQARRLSEMIKL